MIILKKILSVFIILILFLHTNYLAVYYSLYEINTEELTASCCEKKVENCNAHCYLDKKMNDENSKNNNTASSEIKLKITEYVVTDNNSDLISTSINKFYININQSALRDRNSVIDHPPRI